MSEPEKSPSRTFTRIEDGRGSYTYDLVDAEHGGEKPFVADDPADDDIFEPIRDHWRALATWPPHMAVAWVAQPTWEEVVAQAKRQIDEPGMVAAADTVLAALIDGRLIAYGVDVDKVEMSVGLSAQAHDEIPSERWRRLRWTGRSLCDAARNTGTGEKEFYDVQIDRLGLFKLWPETVAEAAIDVVAAPTAIGPIPSSVVQGAEARAARADHAEGRVAFMRERVPNLNMPGAMAALRRHSDEYQKQHGKKPVGDTQHGKDVKALRSSQK